MDELTREKLLAIGLVAMDVDGVMTDGGAFYGSDGMAGVTFNVHDGAGIKYLQRAGIGTAIITGRAIDGVRARAEVLGIEHLFQDAKVKLIAYDQLKERTGLDDSRICFIGDDLPDVPVMRRVGLAVAVANARPEVREIAHVVTATRGGDGAVRELVELVLKTQGKWENILKRYFD